MLNLNDFEKKIYSQNGEDGIISFLLDCVGRDRFFYVEFGVESGQECNTRYLREHTGFHGLMMDGGHENHGIGLYQEFVTAENINDLFKKYYVPHEFELLSIDIDGNDLWVWKAINSIYRPKIVIIEYNGHLPPPLSVTVPYEPFRQWDYSCFHGASLIALSHLAQEKGYTLVGCCQTGVNAFFVRNDLVHKVSKSIVLTTPEQSFKPIQLGIGGLGTTIYTIRDFRIYGHAKMNQTQYRFVEYPSGKEIYIEELDYCQHIPPTETQLFWQQNSNEYSRKI